MELQHFSHEHPLIFIDELSHVSDGHNTHCSGCGELLSGPSFSCVACGFYLHKQCAEAPVEMNHPFHPNHSFALLQSKPYKGGCLCNFCKKRCEHFVYHCSCKVDLHIKCALFLYKLAEKRIGELQHIEHIDPLISTENHGKELNEAKCFVCWKPLLDSEYLSPDSGFYLHVKCVDLPSEINHLLHHDHPLLLQFNKECLPCSMCQQTQEIGFIYCCPICKFTLHVGCATKTIHVEIQHFGHRKHPLILKLNHEGLACQICEGITNGLVYCCSICKFAIHIECAPSPPTIEHKNHPHTFLLLKRRVSFICDACGTPGNYASYTCHECTIMVHGKCIPLPRAIKFYRHHHHLSHKYFLENDEVEMLECGVCHELVKTELGSYFCSKCNYIVHVNCALERSYTYYEVDPTKIDETDEDMYMAPYSRVSQTSINHFSHHHDLEFSEDITDEKRCDACVLFISTSYYYCSQCDFFLHKICAELSLKKHFWSHFDQNLLELISSDGIFQCELCNYETSGFAYYCDKCKNRCCLRCASVSDNPRCEGHEHPLPFYSKLEELCNACGITTKVGNSCKICNFSLHARCLEQPLAVQHKSDLHLLKLTYGDQNNYTESHYCDICEGKKNPNHWYYYCAICDTAAHPKCVVGKYSFIKPGSIYTKGNHSHPLTFVQKIYFYPKCYKCAKPCRGLALECKENGCSYIVHWKCITPF